jgi:menaquinol-cytochrome c reductase iron-sulfur subunit
MASDEQPHLPPPSLWPVGFAIGVAVLLVGLVVSPTIIAPVGGAIALVFGFLWIRDVTAGVRTPVHVEPETRAVAAEPARLAAGGEAAPPEVSGAELERFPRSRFLEGATLGVGGLISGLVAVPAIGFAIWPTFNHQHPYNVDLGPLEDFPEGKYVIATFMLDPKQGEVSRRTAYVRNNGLAGTVPSFTILSNRCAHLGCPVQPNGPVFDNQKKTAKSQNQDVTLIPSQPAGFGCPCHGGQYDTEGNRTAGPPVRALDRYEFSIRDGRLWIGRTYSVGKVDGTGASAKIHKYKLTGPGQHVDDWEQILYPWQPPSS